MSSNPKWFRLYCLAFFLTGSLLICSCRPKNPQEWTVHGPTPLKLEKWWEENRDLLPPQTARELREAIYIISSTTVRPNTDYLTNDSNDPLCRRVDGRKVRDILIEGYQISDESLLNKINIEETYLEQNIRRSARTDSAPKQKQFDQTIRYQRQYIDKLYQTLRHNETRLKELAPELYK